MAVENARLFCVIIIRVLVDIIIYKESGGYGLKLSLK